MGFEMLGSRYLNPYFGSGITTWAALISTVLGALMIGYFIGGHLADKHPRSSLLGSIILVSAFYLFMIPYLIDGIIMGVLDTIGDGAIGVICAASVLLLLPLSILGMYSPFGVRLLLDDAAHAGRVTGWIYGVSTVGNIAGTLATTFWLIPSMGTRSITTVFAIGIALSALYLMFLDHLKPKT
jgi:MFS family permease